MNARETMARWLLDRSGLGAAWDKLDSLAHEDFLNGADNLIAALNAEGFEIARLEQVGWLGRHRALTAYDRFHWHMHLHDEPLFRKLPEETA